MSGRQEELTFAQAIGFCNDALKLLAELGIEASSGHVLSWTSIMMTVKVDDFDLLAERGELSGIKLGRCAPTAEISHHASIVHEAVLARIPKVGIMAVVIRPLAKLAPPAPVVVQPPVDRPARVFDEDLSIDPFDISETA